MPALGEIALLQRDKILGWARDPEGKGPAKVEVCLNGRLLRTLRADRPRHDTEARQGGKIGFRFRIHGTLWRYIHSRDALSFRVAGEELPVRVNNLKLRAKRNRKPVEELFEKLANGYIVTKKGAVKMSIHLNTDWQHAVLDWYAQARVKFRELFGYDLYVVSGTLLGLVRNDGFIPGDDDFDTGYLSRHSEPELIRDEMAHVIKTLRDAGERIRIGRRRNLFHWKSPAGLEIDVFPSWTRGEKYFLTFAIGAKCGDAVRKGFVEREMMGKPVLAPIEAEAVLEGSYGPKWRVPDPLFQWVVPRSTRLEMRKVKLTDEQMNWLRGDPSSPALTDESPRSQSPAPAVDGQSPLS